MIKQWISLWSWCTSHWKLSNSFNSPSGGIGLDNYIISKIIVFPGLLLVFLGKCHEKMLLQFFFCVLYTVNPYPRQPWPCLSACESRHWLIFTVPILYWSILFPLIDHLKVAFCLCFQKKSSWQKNIQNVRS